MTDHRDGYVERHLVRKIKGGDRLYFQWDNGARLEMRVTMGHAKVVFVEQTLPEQAPQVKIWPDKS